MVNMTGIGTDTAPRLCTRASRGARKKSSNRKKKTNEGKMKVLGAAARRLKMGGLSA